MKTNPEILFLKYAFPCSIVLRQRGEINEQMFNFLEHAAINNMLVQKNILEKVFFRAFSRIKALAKEKNKDYWSEYMIKEYFTNRHNKLIEGTHRTSDDGGLDIDKKAPPKLKELCKVHKAKVIKKQGNFLLVKFGSQTRPVLSDLVKDVKIGDKVTIHYGYACEIISS